MTNNVTDPPLMDEPNEAPAANLGELYIPGETNPRSVRPPTSYQLSRYQSTCLFIITAAVVLYGLYTARAILFPITLALVIALPLRPIVRILGRCYIPSSLASLMLVSIVVFAVIAGGMVVWPPAKQWLASAPNDIKLVERKLRQLEGPIAEVKEASKSVEKLAKPEADDPTTLKVEVKQPSLTNAVLSTTGSVVVGMTITVSLVFLLLAFGDRLLDAVVRAWPSRGDRDNIIDMTVDAERTISHYLLTYSLINVALGIVIGTGLWLMGMPNAALWGVMAACLNYIPFVGLAIGTGIVFVVGVISFDSLSYALVAPAIYLAANGIEANMITPMALGRSLKLNAVVIFLFIVIWGWIWGIGGALIAVPMLIVIKVICDHAQRLRPIGDLIGAS